MLHIYLLGSFRVELDGKLLEASHNKVALTQAWAEGRTKSIEQAISMVLQQGVFSFDAR